MKTLSIAIFLTIITSLLTFAETEVTVPKKGARLVCEAPIYNFGERDSSDSVRHTFLLKNEGDAPLLIEHIDTSCGCTVAKDSRKGQEIPPGETTKIKARFNLRGRFGFQQKEILVFSNDSESPSYNLLIKGNVLQEIDVSPDQVSFRHLSHLTATTKTVRLSSEKAFTCVQAKSSSKLFSVSLEKSTEEKNAYDLAVTTHPPLPFGITKAHVTISRKKGPNIIVPISVLAVGALSYAPREIKLSDKNDKSITRYIIVRSGAVKDFKILEVKMPDPQIKVSTSELSSGGFRIRMENIPQTRSLVAKTILIKTDVQSMPIIEVPFVMKGAK